MKKGAKKSHLKKSSRSKADLFEILVADSLAKHFNIKKDFSKLISGLKELVAKFENGKFRITEQDQRKKETIKKIISFFKKEGIDGVKDVHWVGRYHQKEHTLSDIDLILKNNEIIGISVKSTRLGLGTQKNIGYKTLKKYLSLDIDRELERMWRDIRAELKRKGGALSLLSGAPKTIIKNKKRKYPIIERIGKKYGHLVQVKSTKQSIDKFNSLTREEKGNFIKLLLGLGETKRRLLNVVAQKDKVKIYWNEIYNSILSGENLQARRIRDVSYGIYFRDKLILRLQANFTNGIGISPYCQRAFLP